MDLDPEPDQVFRNTRGKAALVFLGCVGFVLLGLWLFTLPVDEYTRRTPPEVITKGVAAIFVLFSGWNGALAFANTVEPSRLILDSRGFRVEGPSFRPLVAWGDVEEFYVEEIQHSKHMFYREAAGYRGAPGRRRGLPRHFEAGPDFIVSALNRRLKAYRQRLAAQSDAVRPQE